MKKVLLSIVAVIGLISVLLAGCDNLTGSGDVVTEKKDFSGFTSVDIGSAYTFDITYSDEYSVTVKADEDLIDYIEVDQMGTNLNIYLSPHHILTDFSVGSLVLEVKITMPVLNSLVVSGETEGSVNGFSSGSAMILNVSGASKVALNGLAVASLSGDISGGSKASGNVTMTSLVVSVSGASKLDLSGSASSMSLNISGDSEADLEEFVVQSVNAVVDGSSEATVFAAKTLDVIVSGASKVFFLGNPTLGQTNVSGASTIKHIDS